MGLVSTKELLSQYFESVSGTYSANLKNRIDVPELYEYEEKINKELIDMNTEELYELFLFIYNRGGKEMEYMVSFSAYEQFASMMRKIFDFYSMTFQPVINLFNTDAMRGANALRRLSQGRKPYRWTEIEKIIQKLHKDFSQDYADYIELIMLLYYNGFSKAEEILMLKGDMINHYFKSVKLKNKEIRLSNRCYELLMKFNKMEEFQGTRSRYLLMSWNGGFFKFIVRPDKVEAFENRSQQSLCATINFFINKNVNELYSTTFNYRSLYLLGFYEYIVNTCGQEKCDELIMSVRNTEYVEELNRLSIEYGFGVKNISQIKRALMPFVDTNKKD